MKLAQQSLGAFVAAGAVLPVACLSGTTNALSCGSKAIHSGGSLPSGSGPAQFLTPPEAEFQVTFTGNTLHMAKRTLRAASLDGRTGVFDPSGRGMHGSGRHRAAARAKRGSKLDCF